MRESILKWVWLILGHRLWIWSNGYVIFPPHTGTYVQVPSPFLFTVLRVFGRVRYVDLLVVGMSFIWYVWCGDVCVCVCLSMPTCLCTCVYRQVLLAWTRGKESPCTPGISPSSGDQWSALPVQWVSGSGKPKHSTPYSCHLTCNFVASPGVTVAEEILTSFCLLTGHIQFCNCLSHQVWVNLTRTPLHINSPPRLRKRHTLSFKPSHFYTCHELFFCRRKQKLAVESNIWIIHASEHTLAEELGTELGESWRHRLIMCTWSCWWVLKPISTSL